jgi:hypothetical protein
VLGLAAGGDRGDLTRIGQREMGAGWGPNESTIVFRVDLADALLALFDRFEHTDVSQRMAKQLQRMMETK